MGKPASHDDLDGLLELEDRFHAAGYQQGAGTHQLPLHVLLS